MDDLWPDRSWVRTEELARIAGVSNDTIQREIQRGNLTAARSGKAYVIEIDEAKRWHAGYEPYAGLKKPRKQGDDASP